MTHLVDILSHFRGDFFWQRFTTKLLDEFALDLLELVDRFDHVHRNTNRTRLVGERTGDRLTDPPRCIRREFEPFSVLELLDRTE